MSLLEKIFKRKKKSTNDDQQPAVSTPRDNRNEMKQTFIESHSLETSDSTNPRSGDTSEDETDYEITRVTKISELKTKLRKFKKQEEIRRQRRSEVMALDAEVTNLMSLIAMSKRQSKVLEEEMLNKKCEMKFLRSEAPEGHELEAKKREPLYYKKYNNAKSASDAKNLLVMIRRRQRALQYLELMTYNKYLELQHSLKFDAMKKHTSLMLQDKSRNFGHLVDAVQVRENSQQQQQTHFGIQSSPSHAQSTSPTRDATTVAISPRTTTPSPAVGILSGVSPSTLSPPIPPLLPNSSAAGMSFPHLFGEFEISSRVDRLLQ